MLHTPALVKRHPDDDTRVAHIAAYRLRPLGEQPRGCGGRKLIDARHLLPDEQPEPIGPEEEARVLDLLVHAHRGEAKFLDQFNLGPEGASAGRGEVRFRPVALRENTAHLVWPIVEE